MTREEIRDWPGLKDLALSWWIGARFFDTGEVCELKLQTVTCLASLYVGKQHRRITSNKPQNRIKRPGIEPRFNTQKKQQKAQIYVSTIYFYIYAYITTF